MRTPELEAAFLATTYRIETPAGDFDLRIGERHPAFEVFLRQQGASNWGIVTACNPGGRLTLEMNAFFHETLQARILQQGWRSLPSRHLADSADWPVELGFCVLDVGEEKLRTLAAGFDQAAVVFGQAAPSAGRLLWIA